MNVSVNRQSHRLSQRTRPWGRLLRLEDRITPAVTYEFDKWTGILTASGDGANDVIVVTRNQEVNFEVNGVPVLANGAGINGVPGHVPVKDIRGLSIDGGAGDDVIDQSAARIPATLGIHASTIKVVSVYQGKVVFVSGGAGNDTITGSMYADRVVGGDGSDVINGGGGDDLVEGLWADLAGDVVEMGAGNDAALITLPAPSVTTGPLLTTMDVGSVTLTYDGGQRLIKSSENFSFSLDGPQTQPLAVAGQAAGSVPRLRTEILREGFEDYEYLKTTSGGPGGEGGGGGAKLSAEWLLYSTGGSGGDRPTESISFNFTKIKCEYTVTGTSGDDTFTVDPGPDPIALIGGGGSDSALVNTGGLSYSQVGSEFLVAGKVPVILSNVAAVTPILWLHGEAARDFLADNSISISRAPGAVPDSSVYSVTNNSAVTISSITLDFSASDVLPDARQSSAGVTFSQQFEEEPRTLAQLAGGASPGRFLLTAAATGIFVGGQVFTGTGPAMARDNPDARTSNSVGVKFVCPPLVLGGLQVHGDCTFATSDNVQTSFINSPITISGGNKGAPTLIGATADGRPLTLDASSGVDSTVPNFTAGTHLYFDGSMIDVALDGMTSGNGSVSQASVSYDGSVVAFITSATNLTDDPDTNGFDDVIVALGGVHTSFYRCYTVHGTSAPAPNGPSRNPHVSGDGSSVFFESLATNLVPGVTDTNNEYDLFRYDVATKTLNYVFSATGVTASNRGVNHWGDRADGKAAVFTTLATNVGSGVGLQIGITSALGTNYVSLPSYVEGVHDHRVAMSPDGSTVAIWTDADVSSLAGVPDTNGKRDLLTIDTATMQVTLRSRNAAGTATSNGATPAKLEGNFDFSFDGDIATTTTATNLPGSTPATDDVALVTMVDDPPSIILHEWAHAYERLKVSPGGGSIGFISNADFRTAGAPDLSADQAWDFDLAAKTFSLASADANGQPTTSPATSLHIAENRRVMLFLNAQKLTVSDADALPDVHASVWHRSLVVAGGLGGNERRFIRGAEGYEVNDPSTGGKVASRIASITDYVYLGSTPGNDSLTIDLDSGLTGLTQTQFDGGEGVNDVTVESNSATGGMQVRSGPRIDVWVNRYRVITEEDLPFPIEWGGTGSSHAFDRVQNLKLATPPTAVEYAVDGTVGQVITVEDNGSPGGGVTVIQGDRECELWATGFRVAGSAGNDTITVNPLDANLPTDFSLSIFGGDGTDQINASLSTVGVFVSGGNGSDTVTGSVYADVVACIRRPDVIFGGLGDDTFIVSPDGGDTIDFGGGLDTLDFSNMDRAVTFDLDKTGAQTFTGTGESLTLTEVAENFIGSAYNDTVTLKLLDGTPRVYDSGGALTVDSVTADAGGSPVFVGNDVASSGKNIRKNITVTLFKSDKSGATRAAVTVVNTTPPQSPTVYINGGAAQRSMVGDLAVPFNFDVQFVGDPSAAFQLQTKAGVPVPFSVEVVRFAGMATAYFTPNNLVNGSMPDGRYVLTVLNSQIVGGLPGNADAVSEFHRQFGDINGDAFTDNVDLVAYRQCNGSDSTMANFDPAFDSNRDGFIDNIDFIAFRQRIGQSP